jgi:hypothetical protein
MDFQTELLARLAQPRAVLKMFDSAFDSPWLEDFYVRHGPDCLFDDKYGMPTSFHKVS